MEPDFGGPGESQCHKPNPFPSSSHTGLAFVRISESERRAGAMWEGILGREGLKQLTESLSPPLGGVCPEGLEGAAPEKEKCSGWKEWRELKEGLPWGLALGQENLPRGFQGRLLPCDLPLCFQPPAPPRLSLGWLWPTPKALAGPDLVALPRADLQAPSCLPKSFPGQGREPRKAPVAIRTRAAFMCL